MINNKLEELLNQYKDSKPDLSITDMSTVKHLVIKQLLERPYFEGIKLDLYMNDLENENITFYNGHGNSVNTISKDEFSSTGGYVFTREQAERLETFQDVLMNAKSLDDLVGTFDEDDALLIKQFSITLPKDEFYSLLSMAKFREDINKDPNHQISYDHHYAQSMLLVGVEQGCSLDNDLKYFVGADNVLKRHLTNNQNVITQESISHGALKGMIRAENKTLRAIFDKKMIDNPDAENSDHKTIYGDLSDILKNPMIRDNTMVGIIFDDRMSGPEKLMKIYHKKYFENVRNKLVNTIDYQMIKPTLEDLYERHADIINHIMEKLDNTFPVLNTSRNDNIYHTKSEFDFNEFFDKTKNKAMIMARDFLTEEGSLLNATLDGYLSKTLKSYTIGFVERLPSDSFRMTQHDIANYHNNIESVMLLKMRGFAEKDLPKQEKPKFVILEQFTFSEGLVEQAFESFSHYIREQNKAGISVIIHTKDMGGFNRRFEELLNNMDTHPNVIISRTPSFEVKMNMLLESLDDYDKKTKVLTSAEKTHLVITALDKMNTQFTESVSSYSTTSMNNVKEFMNVVIESEVANGFKHKNISQWATI